ncbi:MAG: hypothetical protein V8S89_01540 [Oscillospiraceae bacterium]
MNACGSSYLGIVYLPVQSENAATKFFLARISKQKACRNTGHIYCTLAVFPSRIQVNALKRKKQQHRVKNCSVLLLFFDSQ